MAVCVTLGVSTNPYCYHTNQKTYPVKSKYLPALTASPSAGKQKKERKRTANIKACPQIRRQIFAEF